MVPFRVLVHRIKPWAKLPYLVLAVSFGALLGVMAGQFAVLFDSNETVSLIGYDFLSVNAMGDFRVAGYANLVWMALGCLLGILGTFFAKPQTDKGWFSGIGVVLALGILFPWVMGNFYLLRVSQGILPGKGLRISGWAIAFDVLSLSFSLLFFFLHHGFIGRWQSDAAFGTGLDEKRR